MYSGPTGALMQEELQRAREAEQQRQLAQMVRMHVQQQREQLPTPQELSLTDALQAVERCTGLSVAQLAQSISMTAAATANGGMAAGRVQQMAASGLGDPSAGGALSGGMQPPPMLLPQSMAGSSTVGPSLPTQQTLPSMPGVGLFSPDMLQAAATTTPRPHRQGLTVTHGATVHRN